VNYKPTAEITKIIRQCAAREAMPSMAVSSVKLEPGWRCNLNATGPGERDSLNIAIVSDDPDWNDTDLAEHCEYKEFSKGVELTEDGRGIFDFYISNRHDESREICGNVIAYFEGGEMVRVEGYGQPKVLWSKEGGFA
jgi:hypothetical protein